uniref:ERAP1-like C-terminal domain-containing protein n=1 Tax=Ditylenchus dipsaci TaxID=166011 RepID=A0A915ERD7_9BILA
MIPFLQSNHPKNVVLPPDHSLASRFRLLEDAFTLAKTGHVPYRVAFGLSEYLVHETNNFPFNVFTKHMNELHFLLKNFVDATPLENFVVEMLKPLYHRIFAENVMVNDIIATQQEYAMVQLCHWNYSPCLQKAVDAFAKLKLSCKHFKLSDTNCNK